VRSFTDPEDFGSSLSGANAEFTILERGEFQAKLVQISLHRLVLRRAFDNLPRIAHSQNEMGQAAITFRTHPGPSLLRKGVELRLSNIVRRSEGESHFQKSEGFASFGSISLPIAQLESLGDSFVSYDLVPPKDSLSLTPPPDALARLQNLHAAAGQLAEHAPDVVAVPEAAHGLEQALIDAMVGCFGSGEVDADRSALRQHALVMRRFHRIVEEHPDKALFIPEVCKAIGTSDRTLRECCQEQLGISPKRYLLARRMQLVKRALQESDAAAATVTSIATRYGFWELGRFAGEYKSLFGEVPSVTLAHPAREW